MMRARLIVFVALLLAAGAKAQRPIFHPDDFVDPATHDGTIFMTRVAVAGAWNLMDHYRPLDDDDAGFVVLTNSVYFGRFQFDFKHNERLGGDDAAPVRRCDCPEPVFFPTPPPRNATPVAPPSDRFETLQLGFYQSLPYSPNRPPATLRFQLRWERRETDADIRPIQQPSLVERRSGHEQSFALESDLPPLFRVWGTLYIARTSRSGTTDDRTQNEVVAIIRPPGESVGDVLFRGNLAVGAITGRGATGLNLINPSFEAFWRHRRSKVNVHLVWSPQWIMSGIESWQVHHQFAVVVDRVLFLKAFGGVPRERAVPPATATPRGGSAL